MIGEALVVNDDDITLFVATKMIQRANFAEEIVTAHNGAEALAYLERKTLLKDKYSEKTPEFIFLDLNMPEVCGWGFLEIFSTKYASRFPDVRVAILSSSSDRKEIEELKKYELLLDFIDTPISQEKLADIKKTFYKIKYGRLPARTGFIHPN